jgi:hypothetical protein
MRWASCLRESRPKLALTVIAMEKDSEEPEVGHA